MILMPCMLVDQYLCS